MTLKLLLVSVDGTLADSTKNSSVAIRNDLAKLIRHLHAQGVRTVLWSNRKWVIGGESLSAHMSSLAGVPVEAQGWSETKTPSRRRADAVLPILASYNVAKTEAILVGASDEDMLAGVNNGLLHIRSDWYGQQSNYGFSVATVSDLARFCFVFALRKHPIFWKIHGEYLQAAAAGPFSTMIDAYAMFGADARAAAKFGAGHPDFWFYLTVSTLYFGGMLEGINYICGYPGHNALKNGAADPFDEALCRLAKCFRIGFYHDLIVRHTGAPKSQNTKAADRKFATQINSIHLNSKPHKNLATTPNKTPIQLAGKGVLVVDDFCTSGKSLEAARAYLNAAKARVRLFSWLKTINSAYTQIAMPLPLSPFGQNTLKIEPPVKEWPYASSVYDHGAPGELAQIFDLYNRWNWANYA